jgi:hypothetical protein
MTATQPPTIGVSLASLTRSLRDHRLADGVKGVRELAKGDVLAGGGIVEWFLERIVNRRCQAVILNGVAFPPFFPVDIGGTYAFSRDVALVLDIDVDSRFTLVLSGQKAVVLNGISAITLGYGMSDGVLAYPYYGKDKVVCALKRYGGYKSGCLRIEAPAFCEQDANGMIVTLFENNALFIEDCRK